VSAGGRSPSRCYVRCLRQTKKREVLLHLSREKKIEIQERIYNQHVRLLSPSLLVGLAPPTLLGYRSRHCHAINCTQNALAGVLSAMAWSIRGEVKDNFSPSTGREKIFPCLPAPVREARGWVVPWVLHSSISVASLLSSDDVDRFLTLTSRCGYLVGNT
jgi:hypothetical protein